LRSIFFGSTAMAGAVAVAGTVADLSMIFPPELLREFVDDGLRCGLETGDVFQQAEQGLGEVVELHTVSEFLDEDFQQLLLLIGC
jgi:hypothetical protein